MRIEHKHYLSEFEVNSRIPFFVSITIMVPTHALSLSLSHTHTHTHTHIYIYIYIYTLLLLLLLIVINSSLHRTNNFFCPVEGGIFVPTFGNKFWLFVQKTILIRKTYNLPFVFCSFSFKHNLSHLESALRMFIFSFNFKSCWKQWFLLDRRS